MHFQTLALVPGREDLAGGQSGCDGKTDGQNSKTPQARRICTILRKACGLPGGRVFQNHVLTSVRVGCQGARLKEAKDPVRNRLFHVT